MLLIAMHMRPVAASSYEDWAGVVLGWGEPYNPRCSTSHHPPPTTNRTPCQLSAYGKPIPSFPQARHITTIINSSFSHFDATYSATLSNSEFIPRHNTSSTHRTSESNITIRLRLSSSHEVRMNANHGIVLHPNPYRPSIKYPIPNSATRERGNTGIPKMKEPGPKNRRSILSLR